MGRAYKKYKNFIEKYLDSNGGRRFFNIVYSIGAAIVILGAMFKILHLPFGNQMLMIGMITEAIVFLLSAFEKPSKEYKWEEIYPILAEDENFIPKSERVHSVVSTGSTINSSTNTNSQVSQNNNTTNNTIEQSKIDRSSTISSEPSLSNRTNDTYYSTTSNDLLNNSAEYVDQLAQMSGNMEKFAKVTESLAQISDTLLKSFETIIANSDGIGNNTQGYITQMETLNRNISGLNTIYEIQLKGVSGQINTIENINAGLDRIKHLYDGSLADSSIFKTETEKMAQQLAELNRVYARLLQAMTSNMNIGGGFPSSVSESTSPKE